jgi:hypothetical protein
MSRYTCAQCGKSSGLPDYCCGKPMLPRGSYACKSCGLSSSRPQPCCGQDMVRI